MHCGSLHWMDPAIVIKVANPVKSALCNDLS